jgi:hypothetical protein
MARRKSLLHFRHTGHPWPAGNCSCISGIPAIHGPPEIAPAFPAYRPSMAITKKARTGRAFFACLSWNPNYARARQPLALLFALLLVLPASTTRCAPGAAVVEKLAVTEVMTRLKQIPRINASPPVRRAMHAMDTSRAAAR